MYYCEKILDKQILLYSSSETIMNKQRLQISKQQNRKAGNKPYLF